MSMKICLKEVTEQGFFNERISITIDCAFTFFDEAQEIGLSIFEMFGSLYATTNTNGDDTIVTHGEIGYDDVLLAIDYCTTDEAIDKFKDIGLLHSIKSDFEDMESFLRRRNQDVFSIYIL